MSCVFQDGTRLYSGTKKICSYLGRKCCLHLRSNLKTEDSNTANVLCDAGDNVLAQPRTYECSQQGWYPGNLSVLFDQDRETAPERKWKTRCNFFPNLNGIFRVLILRHKLNITRYSCPVTSARTAVSNTSKPCRLQYCSKTQKGAKHLLSGQGLPLWIHEHTSTLYRSLLSETILVDVVNRSRLLQM